MAKIQPAEQQDRQERRPTSRGQMWPRVGILLLTFTLVVVSFASIGEGQSMLEPASPSAERVSDLWWLMFWLGFAVFAIVLVLVVVALTRGDRGEGGAGLTDSRRQSVVLIGGVAIPLVILIIVFGATLWTLSGLAEDRSESDWTVEIIGHQFWWEVRYPDEDVITANEIHVPAGEPVEFRFTSDDVIHSFWVPELHGKLDLMPGTTTSLTVTADEPGTYRGQCAQFCGVQHANMALYVIADEPSDFRDWLAQQRQDAESPPEGSQIARGEEVFLSSACVYCHTVRGSNAATSDIGPDLTHLASRRTIAAGILENNQANLAGWILDPQQIKPGNLMPAVNLDSEELLALLAYLNSLD